MNFNQSNQSKEEKMFTRKALFMLLIVLSMGTTILAQSLGTVVFVTLLDGSKIDPETDESPDMPHIYALEDADYDVIRFYNASLSTASQATLDTLENANLIVMGRSTPSSPYASDKVVWNDITTPILNLEMWAVRNTRLNWFNTEDMTSVTDIDSDSVSYAVIEAPDDPVFEGLDTASPVPWIIGTYDGINTADQGNGILLVCFQFVLHIGTPMGGLYVISPNQNPSSTILPRAEPLSICACTVRRVAASILPATSRVKTL